MSLFSRLLGFDSNNAGQSAFGQSQQQLGNLGGVADQYGNLAQLAGQDYGQDNTAYRNAAQGYTDALGRGFGDADRASYIAGQTAPAMGAYQSGQSNLTSNLAARGLGDSGSAYGALSGLEGQRAGAVAQAGNSANNYFTNAALARHAQLTGLTGGMAQTDYGRETGAMGAAGGLYGNLASTYRNIGNQQYQNQAAQNQALFNNIGSLASTAGQIYGMTQGVPMGGMGGRAQTSSTPGSVNDGGFGYGMGGTFGDGHTGYSAPTSDNPYAYG